MNAVKHGGCFDCGTTTVEILFSISVPGEIMSVAVCPTCYEARARAKRP